MQSCLPNEEVPASELTENYSCSHEHAKRLTENSLMGRLNEDSFISPQCQEVTLDGVHVRKQDLVIPHQLLSINSKKKKQQKKHFLPDICSAAVTVFSCEIECDAVEQRDTERLVGVGLKHSMISVRPLVGIRGRSRSNSSAASLSTALYLQNKMKTSSVSAYSNLISIV